MVLPNLSLENLCTGTRVTVLKPMRDLTDISILIGCGECDTVFILCIPVLLAFRESTSFLWWGKLFSILSNIL